MLLALSVLILRLYRLCICRDSRKLGVRPTCHESQAQTNDFPRVGSCEDTNRVMLLFQGSRNEPQSKTDYIWGKDVAKGCSATPYRFFKLQLESFAWSNPVRADGHCEDGEGRPIHSVISPTKLLTDFLGNGREIHEQYCARIRK